MYQLYRLSNFTVTPFNLGEELSFNAVDNCFYDCDVNNLI